MDLARYFDHAATTPVDPAVLAEMLPYLREDAGNAHSIHAWGRFARAAVERARERVAGLLGLEDPSEVFFTSGATEANNWALAQGSAACSPFEHSSVLEPVLARGGEVLANDGYTLHAPRASPDVLAVMAVNNETGAVIEPVGEGRSILRDLTQAAGRLDLGSIGYDLATLSAHKIYGPKGVGALAVRSDVEIEPLLRGGGQESGMRAGTLNVPGIVGFGAAAALAMERMEADGALAAECRAAVVSGLAGTSDWRANEAPRQTAHILSLSFWGLEGETLVVEMDGAGFGISAGAACSSEPGRRNHVLEALGVEEAWARGTVRISFGRGNTVETAARLGRELARAVGALRGPR